MMGLSRSAPVIAAVIAFLTPWQVAQAAPTPLVLTASANPVADLYPGATGAAQFTVTNPNPYPVRLLSLSLGTVRSSDQLACPSTLVSTMDVDLQSDLVVQAGET